MALVAMRIVVVMLVRRVGFEGLLKSLGIASALWP
jgi:hypothetical protein